jgi:hypothetical protein
VLDNDKVELGAQDKNIILQVAEQGLKKPADYSQRIGTYTRAKKTSLLLALHII